jgi:nucleotide-binding universal stress UspA family protein
MKRFLKNILWPTDFSHEALDALLYADIFAREFGAGITALHVAPDLSLALYDEASPSVQEELIRQMDVSRKDARASIQELAQKKSISLKKIVVAEGSPSKKIIETAEKEKTDLIVMGKRGLSLLEKILVGSVANHVLRHSPVPVLLTKKRRKKLEVKKILVPTDFSKEEDIERDFAWKVAQRFGASLTFLYVLELYGYDFRMVDHMFDAVLDKFKARVKKDGWGVPVFADVVRATTAAQGIESYVRKHHYDLVVMATCAGPLGRFLLGSTTEKVVSAVDVPVFAIPPKVCY